MRPYALSFAAALLVSALGVSAHASDADFKLVNKTGFPIDEVHVSPHRADHWGGNILPGQALHNDETLRVHVPHDVRACRFEQRLGSAIGLLQQGEQQGRRLDLGVAIRRRLPDRGRQRLLALAG